ncbi:response regulator [Cohnella mopanensis]|uniref:response regulator n=1 Tax=Cohnella mopanensis TaxID=2911966 RepID=UPI001EF7A082|nr:response regulator [Cohnella mopanensis]
MLRSLRFKIVIVLILINTASFLLMSLINYETTNKHMNNQLIDHSLASLKNTVANLDTMLNLRVKQAELLSRSIPIRMQTIPQKLTYLQDEIHLTDISTRCIGIADQDGILSLADGSSLQIDGIPAYHLALAGTSSYSSIMLDKDGNPILWLMVPLRNLHNEIDGVIGLAINSNKLFDGQLDQSAGNYKDSSVILIDRDTNLLYYQDASLILKRNYIKDEPGIRDFAEQLRSSREGYGEADVSGRVLKMFYMKMPKMDWYVVFSVSKKEFEAPLRNSTWINMGLIALMEIIFGAFLYLITQRSILQRLKQIVKVTKNVAAGNFYPPLLHIESQDEIGMLAKSVNGMIDNLQELFEPFQAFIRHNQYAMLVTDSKFIITSFNKRAEEMLGYAEHEVIGRKSLLLWHDHDQLYERAKFYSDKLKRTISPDEDVLFVLAHKGFLPDWEWIWINREGKRMRVSLNTSVMRYPDGTIKGYVLIARDISEIKKAVETNTRLLEIMESAHDMIATFDMRGHIFYLNQAGHSFLGIQALSEHNNRLSQYMPIPTTVRFADGLTEAQKLGFWQSEIEIIGVNNTIQTASITVVAHQSEDERDTFFSTIVRDISEQKEIERQLVKAKDEADEANEAKSSFLARMSHEIRTPLNGIIGLSYLLQRSELTELQAEYIRQVSDSSQNLLRILNDVLDFSKLEADKLMLEKVPFKLEDSLQRLCGIFSVLLGPKPVDFIVHMDPQVPDRIIGDPIRLEQVLLNLGSNAIKFTNFGLIEMTISLVESKENHVRLLFSVQDSGIGMTELQQAQLFTPFVQADEKTSRKYGGTGLGLVISHTLVELMGGFISVESSYQVGSTFSFELDFPLHVQDSVPSASDHRKFDLRVVVLEDHPRVAEHWRDLLSSFGCHVITLSAWDQAKSLLQDRQWDLFIVDMEAGDMHGEETWVDWKMSLDAHGILAICSTTMLGRDALLQLPDEYKPAAVLVKPASSIQIQQALQVIHKSKQHSLVTLEAAKTTNIEGPIHSSNTQDGASASYRILVVDDQVINRLVVQQLLGQQGYEVELLESGTEAVTLAEMNQPPIDLILMDLHMPVMDGIEATTLIRKSYTKEQLPIIALTADMTIEQHKRCLNAGMNDIMTKPIDPNILYAMLGKWLSAPLLIVADEAVQTNELWPDSPRLQVSIALQRLSGKNKLYLRLLDKFVQQYSDVESRLNNLLSEDDRTDAIRLVHSLSGAAGHLGAISVQESASAMEIALKADKDWRHAQDRLVQEVRETLLSIHDLLLQKRN